MNLEAIKGGWKKIDSLVASVFGERWSSRLVEVIRHGLRERLDKSDDAKLLESAKDDNVPR